MFKCFSCFCCQADDKNDPTGSAGTVKSQTIDANGLFYKPGEANAEALEESTMPLQAQASKIWWAQFDASIDRSSGKSMGLAVRLDPEVQMLQIMSVDAGTSAVSDWNAEHPEAAVKDNDYIVSVNSRRDIDGIVHACKKNALLQVRFQRLLNSP